MNKKNNKLLNISYFVILLIFSFTFLVYANTTNQSANLKVSSSNLSSNFSVDGAIQIYFNKDIQEGEKYNDIELDLNLADSKTKIEISKKISGKILIVQPINKLEYEKQYSLILPSGSIKDKDGNIFSDDVVLNFATQKDNISPVIKGISPANNSTNVNVYTNIIMTFSEPILITDSSKFDDIILKNSSGDDVAINIDVNNDTIVIKPTNPLKYNTSYTIFIKSGAIKDKNGNVLKTSITSKFTTTEHTPPKIVNTTPKDGEKGIQTNAVIKVIFDENIRKSSRYDAITLKTTKVSGGKYIDINVPIDKTISGNTLIIKPLNDLSQYSKYYYTIPAGAVEDLNGNTYEGTRNYKFTTTKDNISPVLKSILPVNAAKNVSVTSNITISYNENIYKSSRFSDIVLKTSNNKVVSTKIQIINNSLVIVPVNKLDYNTTYFIIIPSKALKDAANNQVITSYKYSFTTEKDTEKPFVKSVTIDKYNNILSIVFNENIVKSTNFNKLLLKDSTGNIIKFEYKISGDILNLKFIEKNISQDNISVFIPSSSVKDSVGNEIEKDFNAMFFIN
ncbi:hypothetical protein FDN13_06825 [Caloramator sp. E03]|uniref:Ig-like domain-containing protein n=1 Tax=Caloramator sp. E03 TaxID=2576307 RepID=UPI001110181E|nr:Ig-like domain-containing protein [Caloramator sp. E03]QCX33448.1 hypothetical protein FDN13_06825 [Caloramator sp. E03]